jgi:hypothetical protein
MVMGKRGVLNLVNLKKPKSFNLSKSSL